MPARSRKSPAPIIRPRRTEEPDALGGTPAPVAAPTAAKSDGKPRARHTTTKAPDPDTKTADNTAGGGAAADTKPRRRQQSVLFDVDLLDRLRAAVTYLGAYEPEAGIQSLPDLLNPAAYAAVEELERRYNNGEPFRKVARMAIGRRPGT